jgi:hypothetical protein
MAARLVDRGDFGMTQWALAYLAPVVTRANHGSRADDDSTDRDLAEISGFLGSRQGELHI